MRIHRLTTGRVRGPRRPSGIRRYLIRDFSDETLPVNAFLIEHPAGLCLVDAGQSVAAAQSGYLPRWHPFIRIARFELRGEDEAAAQIRRLGMRTEDVRWVVLTHLHTDHVGGLADFASAEIVVAETEWERAGGLRGRLAGYVPKQLPRGLAPKLVRLVGPPVGPFASSLDLVGDGTVLLVPLPGHTPGQIGVLARTEGGAALIGGDVAHDPGELEITEPLIADYCRRESVEFLAAHDDELQPLIDLCGTANTVAR